MLYGTSVNRTERRVEAGKHHVTTRSCTGLTPQPNSHTRKSIHAAHYIRKPLLTDARRRHGRFADMWRCLGPASLARDNRGEWLYGPSVLGFGRIWFVCEHTRSSEPHFNDGPGPSIEHTYLRSVTLFPPRGHVPQDRHCRSANVYPRASQGLR